MARLWVPLFALLACTTVTGAGMTARERIRASFVKPAAPSNVSIIQQRREWEDVVAKAPLPPGVTVAPINAGVAADLITPSVFTNGRMVVYVHGGGFVSGSPRTHRVLGAYLALAARSEVLLVDYRLAPEHSFPAARDDVIAAYGFALARQKSAKQLVLAGDSAGAHVALSSLLEIRNRKMPLPAGIVLISPWLDLAQRGESMQTRMSADPLVLEEDLAQCAALYLGARSPHDPEVALLQASFKGLPPFFIDVGDDEILLSDSTRVADAVRAVGGKAEIKIWSDLWHVFHAWVPELPEARTAIDGIGRFVRRVTHAAQK